MSYRLWWLLASGIRISAILIPLASKSSIPKVNLRN